MHNYSLTNVTLGTAAFLHSPLLFMGLSAWYIRTASLIVLRVVLWNILWISSQMSLDLRSDGFYSAAIILSLLISSLSLSNVLYPCSAYSCWIPHGIPLCSWYIQSYILHFVFCNHPLSLSYRENICHLHIFFPTMGLICKVGSVGSGHPFP